MAKGGQVEKYTKAGRILHHTHTTAFILLFITGLILYIPGLGVIAQGGWTRIIHRIAALVFIIAPIVYLILRPRTAMEWLKEAFTWGSEDLGWVKAFPGYYFLGKEEGMPPQDHINTGQKLWWFIVVVFSALFIITGIIMWLLKGIAAPGVLQAMVIIHDISFFVTGAMLFVHIYLGVFHPMMKESWNAIWKGTISAEYAKSHHGKWYQRIAKKG